MKKVLLITALALGLTTVSDRTANACYSVNSHIGALIGLGLLGDNPFISMGSGPRRLFPGLYAATGMTSMAYGSMGVMGQSMNDSMAFGMSPYAASMGVKINLRSTLQSASLLEKEFAALDRRTAVDLGSQVASGPSRDWAPLSAKEIAALEVR